LLNSLADACAMPKFYTHVLVLDLTVKR
jgi:hypothetical protein